MQVNVFITHQEGALRNSLLVPPQSPQAAIPKEYQAGWQYFATVNSGDEMFGGISARSIELDILTAGHALVDPKVVDRP